MDLGGWIPIQGGELLCRPEGLLHPCLGPRLPLVHCRPVTRLAGLHNQDHSGAQCGDILVIALEGGDGGLVGGGDRIEGLTGLHFVVEDAGLVGGFSVRFCGFARGSLGVGDLLVLAGMLTGPYRGRCRLRIRLAAGGHWQVEREHGSATQTVAAQAVPTAKHLGGDSEILGDGLNGVALTDFVADDPAGIRCRVADGVLAGETGIISLASLGRSGLCSEASSRLASAIDLGVVR